MAILRRGLQDVPTMSGLIEARSQVQPHRVFLKISCLELERSRRGQEREAARRRIAEIDARMAEIDAQTGGLFRRLAAVRQPAADCQPGAPAPSGRKRRGLTFRY